MHRSHRSTFSSYRRRKRGYTLIEVVIAALLLAAVLGPFLSHIVSFAKSGEDNEKLQMATNILASVKEELMSVRFKDFLLYADKGKPDANNEYILDDMFYPHSKDQVMEFQKKYRDFDVKGVFKFVQRKGRDPKERSMLHAKIEVTWEQPKIGKQTRETSVSIIDPKS
ncbi:MAG: prepilin-type N-terminal cleavage/methylation domain-containing protein [Candidatus Ozemobacteraceae bacterium]